MSRFDVPAFGQIEEKPFANIPTSIKLLVVAGIAMWFATPKRTKALANPRKRKNPSLGWDDWEREHPSKEWAGDSRSGEEKEKFFYHKRGEPERITQPWAPKPLRFVEVLSPEMAAEERMRWRKGWAPKKEGDVLSYRRKQSTVDKPLTRKKKEKEKPSYHTEYSAKAPEGGLWWEYQARRTDRRGEDEREDWENLSYTSDDDDFLFFFNPKRKSKSRSKTRKGKKR